GLDVGVASDPEAAELLEEARLLDSRTPGAAHARVRHGSHRGARHPWGELRAVRGGVVVASTSVEEDAIHPAELPLQVERLGIPPFVRTVRDAHRVETLPEVLVFVASAENEHRGDLPELRWGQRDVVVGEVPGLLARGLRPLRR